MRRCSRPRLAGGKTAGVTVLLALSALAQSSPFTLDQVLGFAFPTELTAAPAGGKIAWVINRRGVRNIMAAEPPAYRARPVTAYSEDDGNELSELAWTPDASAIIFTRATGENPALNPKGTEQAVWIAALDGSAPRRIGEGNSAVVSNGRVAFLRGGKIWWAPLDGKTPPAPAFQDRGNCARLRWSPDGTRLAFDSRREDHSFIGVYDFSASTLRYLDPSTDFDLMAEWSPDGRSVAFVRLPSTGMRPVREARRTGEPWSIRVASAETGVGREIWRAPEGRGSVFREITARNQVLWAAGNLIVFPWEGDGWTHLYSIPVSGGKPLLLTPGNFEVEQVALTGDRLIFNSNQNDIDRRHLWRVSVAGSPATAITSGLGIEWAPTPTGGPIAFLCSDALHPPHPAIQIGNGFRDIEPNPNPDFPLDHMVTPEQVVVPSTDRLPLHGQLFLPPTRPAGTRSPAVVFFHGGPRRQMLLGWHPMYYYSNAYALNQYLANSGYVVLSVNFRSGIGYGLDFREALNFGASGASDFNDVRAAGEYLRARADVDGSRIGAWGGSYGGYLTAMALARASDVYKAGSDFSGVHDWALELDIPVTAPDYKVAFDSSPLAFVDTWRSPVLLIHGDDDPDVKFKNTVILADALRLRKVEVEELIFPDEAHDFLLYRSWRDAYRATVQFFSHKLR
ncbi:MAG TPA: prolyl oligopeptidase family serine peptidase [Bryobacteraceae bacterium]|nr:prolyl oligopeptidase family serine peptidase [Bryobacteraceae bacterium]